MAEVVERHRSRMVEGCEGEAKAVSRRVSMMGKIVGDGRAQWRVKGAKAMLDAFFEPCAIKSPVACRSVLLQSVIAVNHIQLRGGLVWESR